MTSHPCFTSSIINELKDAVSILASNLVSPFIPPSRDLQVDDGDGKTGYNNFVAFVLILNFG